MKTILLALATLATTPAMAQTFTGPRAEVRVGADHVNVDTTAGKPHVNANGVTYGVALGYDVPVIPHVIAGVEASVDGTSADGSVKNVLAVDAKRDVEVGGRVGYVLGNVMVYGKLAYANDRFAFNARNLTKEGLRYGGGLEFQTTRHTYVKAEYRTTDFDPKTASHQGLVGFGVRF